MNRSGWAPAARWLGVAALCAGCGASSTTTPGAGDDGTDVGGAATGSSGDDGSATAGGLPIVELHTTAGNLVLELRPDVAPNTVANFIAYAQSGFYDGSDGLEATIMHRVVPGYVVQGGGLTADLTSKATMPAIANEAGGLSNVRGSLAMALVPGDADSAASQFFINVTDNPELDAEPSFTVFATVALGLPIVDAMSAVPTQTVDPYDDVPVTPIVIESVTVL